MKGLGTNPYLGVLQPAAEFLGILKVKNII